MSVGDNSKMASKKKESGKENNFREVGLFKKKHGRESGRDVNAGAIRGNVYPEQPT
jgi:hypothetical protein